MQLLIQSPFFLFGRARGPRRKFFLITPRLVKLIGCQFIDPKGKWWQIRVLYLWPWVIKVFVPFEFYVYNDAVGGCGLVVQVQSV